MSRSDGQSTCAGLRVILGGRSDLQRCKKNGFTGKVVVRRKEEERVQASERWPLKISHKMHLTSAPDAA